MDPRDYTASTCPIDDLAGTAERLMRNVRRPRAGREVACWMWTGPTHGGSSANPFGRLGITARGRSFAPPAYVVMWRLNNNGAPVPDGQYVTHNCGVLACCNPSHLMTAVGDHRQAQLEALGRA